MLPPRGDQGVRALHPWAGIETRIDAATIGSGSQATTMTRQKEEDDRVGVVADRDGGSRLKLLVQSEAAGGTFHGGQAVSSGS
jgi:hypothetical protein